MDNRIKAIEFIEDKHEYWFTDAEGKHKRLHGVTKAIGEITGKSFPDFKVDSIELGTIYGTDVHKEVENYFNNDGILSTEGAKWVVETLNNFAMEHCTICSKMTHCEVMVSDFEGTASKVDVVMHNFNTKEVYLFDIKTTSKFDREYCSLQLSVYKRLYEECYDEKVAGMYVLGTKSKRLFHILEKEASKVQKILDMNKAI